jgi:hypothetical protein
MVATDQMEPSAQSPPRTIPDDLLSRYTLEGQIPVVDWYFDDSVQHKQFEWTDALIDECIEKYSIENIESGPISGEFYAGAPRFHLEAFRRSPEAIQGKDIAVIGSLLPWIECICLQLGAASVTTVEYNVPAATNRIQTMSYTSFTQLSEQFDTIISYSSIEHSGLGRYGDPLDPEGDLRTMKHCAKALREGGMFFLGVPMGKDTLVWNAHRVYGPLRYAKLIEGFEELFWIGAVKQRLFKQEHFNHKQPVIALRKRKGAQIAE